MFFYFKPQMYQIINFDTFYVSVNIKILIYIFKILTKKNSQHLSTYHSVDYLFDMF